MSFWTSELGAERHAQADLAGAADDDVRHDAEAAERDCRDARRKERQAHVLGEA